MGKANLNNLGLKMANNKDALVINELFVFCVGFYYGFLNVFMLFSFNYRKITKRYFFNTLDSHPSLMRACKK